MKCSTPKITPFINGIWFKYDNPSWISQMYIIIFQNLCYNTRISDIHGKEMLAVEVFGLVILYLKNHLLQRLRGQDSLSTIDINMIHWVLTVPAIWNDKAKQFMRIAGEKVLWWRNCNVKWHICAQFLYYFYYIVLLNKRVMML